MTPENSKASGAMWLLTGITTAGMFFFATLYFLTPKTVPQREMVTTLITNTAIKLVDVPGLGTVEFPASMSMAEIQDVLRKHFGATNALPMKQEFFDKLAGRPAPPVHPASTKADAQRSAESFLADADIGLAPAPAASLNSHSHPPTHSSANYIVGSGHWIDDVMDDGNLVKLEDDSLWKVSPLDVVNSALWLPVSNITVIDSDDPSYPYKLINTDDDEVVNAQLLDQ